MKFRVLNIEGSETNREADGPGYEHLDEQGIVDLVSAEPDDLDDDDDSTNHQLAYDIRYTPRPHFQPKAMLMNTSTVVQLWELAG